MEQYPTSSMLSIAQPAVIDVSVESCEFREYESQNPAALNNGQDIQIDIHNQDIYTHPTRSYLLVEGRLSSTGDAAYTAATLISLINNAIPYLFSRIHYHIYNQEIENIMSPGQVTTMKGMLIYGDDFSKAEGLNVLAKRHHGGCCFSQPWLGGPVQNDHHQAKSSWDIFILYAAEAPVWLL